MPCRAVGHAGPERRGGLRGAAADDRRRRQPGVTVEAVGEGTDGGERAEVEPSRGCRPACRAVSAPAVDVAEEGMEGGPEERGGSIGGGRGSSAAAAAGRGGAALRRRRRGRGAARERQRRRDGEEGAERESGDAREKRKRSGA